MPLDNVALAAFSLILMAMYLLIVSRRIEMRDEEARAKQTEEAARKLIAYANGKSQSIDDDIPAGIYVAAAARLADLIKGEAYERLVVLVQRRQWLQGAIRLAFHSNARRRYRAIRTLEGFNCPVAVHALRQVMANDISDELRKSAALALLRFDALPSARDTICFLQMDQSPIGITELSVLESLAKTDGPVLEAATRASNPDLRNAAIAALGSSGDAKVFAKLVGWARCKNASKRRAVAAALERSQHEGANDVLLRLLHDADPGVRYEALHSLVKRKVTIPEGEKDRLRADSDAYIVSFAGNAWRQHAGHGVEQMEALRA